VHPRDVAAERDACRLDLITAAVDPVDGAGEVGGLLGGQEGDEVIELDRLAEAADRDRRREFAPRRFKATSAEASASPGLTKGLSTRSQAPPRVCGRSPQARGCAQSLSPLPR
jgi:hypothetical protein